MRDRTVLFYTGFQLSFALLFWVPIFFEYQVQIGLTPEQIFSIQSIYYWVFCFLEIPTGYWADRFGCLQCMRMSSGVLVLTHLFPVFMPNYFGMLLHFIFLALARSMVSGASSAYLYHYLLVERGPSEFKQIEGRARAYGLVAKVICWAAVGYAMSWRLTAPYELTLISAVAAGFFAFSLSPVKGPKNFKSQLKLQEGLVKIMGTLQRSPLLGAVILQGISISVLSRICQVNLFQPLLKEKGFPVSSLGIVMAVMTLSEALGAAFPNLWRRYFSDFNSVSILTLLIASSLLFVSYFGQFGTIIGLACFSLWTGFSYPIQRQLIQDAIGSSGHRATLLSVESLVDRAVCAWVASCLGSVISENRLDSFLRLSAMVCIGGILVIHLVIMKKNTRFETSSHSTS